MRKFMLITVLVLVVSCAGGAGVRTEEVDETTLPEGTYDVLLYETQGPEGERNAFVILDVEGDTYEFVPEDLGEHIKTREKVRSDEALERASVLLGIGSGKQYRLRRIMSEDVPIGYELVPEDSYPTARPVTNILSIKYSVDPEGKVHLHPQALPYLEKGDR